MTAIVDPAGPELCVLPTNPAPEGVRAGYFKTGDGIQLRYATAPRKQGPQRGTVCLVQGRTEFIEKYFETIADFQSRGFAVATFDWRGQGMSSRALADHRKSHVRDFREYDEDLATFLEQVVKPIGAGALLALAHSMGAHILLRTLHDRPRAFCAAVLSAPMLAVSTRGYPPWAV